MLFAKWRAGLLTVHEIRASLETVSDTKPNLRLPRSAKMNLREQQLHKPLVMVGFILYLV
jgi:hypothetical protein